MIIIFLIFLFIIYLFTSLKKETFIFNRRILEREDTKFVLMSKAKKTEIFVSLENCILFLPLRSECVLS